jgi:cell division protein FtsX
MVTVTVIHGHSSAMCQKRIEKEREMRAVRMGGTTFGKSRSHQDFLSTEMIFVAALFIFIFVFACYCIVILVQPFYYSII